MQAKLERLESDESSKILTERLKVKLKDARSREDDMRKEMEEGKLRE